MLTLNHSIDSEEANEEEEAAETSPEYRAVEWEDGSSLAMPERLVPLDIGHHGLTLVLMSKSIAAASNE